MPPRAEPSPEVRPRRAAWLRRGLLVVLVVAAAVVADTALTAGLHGPAPTPATTAKGHRSPTVRGRIASIDGDTWTVASDDGEMVAVALTADTKFGTSHTPAQRGTFAVGSSVGVIGTRQDGHVLATRVITTLRESRAATPTAKPPVATTPPKPVVQVPNVCAVNADLAAGVTYAAGRVQQAAAAVLDTETGAYYAAGDADAPYNTASVVKVFIATDLLVTGQMTGQTATTAYTMMAQSDDDAADALYGLVDGDDVVPALAAHYGIADLGSPPADTGQWGETKVTANGLAHFYAAVKKDPAVWPWLSKAMANTVRVGSDGTDQYFGIPSASNDWAIKQGWMTGLGPGSTYNSTGYVQGDRYVVVLLTYGSVSQYGTYMSETITQMARDVMPGGQVGGTSPATASCS